MLLESQYNQFKEDLNVGGKPKGGMAFITDFEKKDKLLAITHAHPPPEDKRNNAGKALPLAMPAPPSGKKPEEAELLENNDLPRF